MVKDKIPVCALQKFHEHSSGLIASPSQRLHSFQDLFKLINSYAFKWNKINKYTARNHNRNWLQILTYWLKELANNVFYIKYTFTEKTVIQWDKSNILAVGTWMLFLYLEILSFRCYILSCILWIMKVTVSLFWS